MPNHGTSWRKIDGPDTVGGSHGPNAGSGGNGSSAPNGIGNHGNCDVEDGTFLPHETPYLT